MNPLHRPGAVPAAVATEATAMATAARRAAQAGGARPLPAATARPAGPAARLAGWVLAAAGVAALLPLGGCAPLVVGAAMAGTAVVVTDPRTAGTQVEDEGIELKGGAQAKYAGTERGHVNVTSYNRIVLLTGEVPDEATKGRVEQAVNAVENVRAVVNELAVAGASSVASRTNDSVLTTKVKATFVDAKALRAAAIKVVTERGVVYLMGLVTDREAQRAGELARAVPGVAKVVRVFEVVSEADLTTPKPRN